MKRGTHDVNPPPISLFLLAESPSKAIHFRLHTCILAIRRPRPNQVLISGEWGEKNKA